MRMTKDMGQTLKGPSTVSHTWEAHSKCLFSSPQSTWGLEEALHKIDVQ